MRAHGQAGGTERPHGTCTVDGDARVARCARPPCDRVRRGPRTRRRRPARRARPDRARLGRRATDTPATVLARSLGARDLVIGAGLAVAAAHDRDPTTVAARRRPRRHRRRHRHPGRGRRHPAQRAGRHDRARGRLRALRRLVGERHRLIRTPPAFEHQFREDRDHRDGHLRADGRPSAAPRARDRRLRGRRSRRRAHEHGPRRHRGRDVARRHRLHRPQRPQLPALRARCSTSSASRASPPT